MGGAEGVGCVEFWSVFEILVMSYASIFYFIYYLGTGLAEGSVLGELGVQYCNSLRAFG